MWFNDVFFIPPTKTGFSGEKTTTNPKEFGYSGEEGICKKPCSGAITLDKK
jgi:hypothetical protein